MIKRGFIQTTFDLALIECFEVADSARRQACWTLDHAFIATMICIDFEDQPGTQISTAQVHAQSNVAIRTASAKHQQSHFSTPIPAKLSPSLEYHVLIFLVAENILGGGPFWFAGVLLVAAPPLCRIFAISGCDISLLIIFDLPLS